MKENNQLLMLFKSGIFSLKPTQGKGSKRLTPKQILQRLSIALAQVKAGNISKNYSEKLGKLFIHCINQKKLLKKHIVI